MQISFYLLNIIAGETKMPRVWVKKRQLENGEIMLRRLGWGNYLLVPVLNFCAIPSLILPWVHWLRPWRDWKLLDNEKHQCELELKELLDIVSERLAYLKDIQERLKRESDEIKKHLDKSGRIAIKESQKFTYPVRLTELFFWGKQKELSPVDPSWKKKLNAKLFEDKNKAPTVMDTIFGKEFDLDLNSSKNSPDDCSEVRVVAPESYGMHLSHGEGGMNIDAWKLDESSSSSNKRSNSQESKGKQNHLKNKPKGMPQNIWDDTVRAMRDEGIVD